MVRVSDEMPLGFIQYDRLDNYKPVSAQNNRAVWYSAYGENLIIHPPGNGEQLRVRYYGTHIGTDSTGATPKMRLSLTNDLTMLDDTWENALIDGAARIVRQKFEVDAYYKELEKDAEAWEHALEDMGNQPGEDAPPMWILEPFSMDDEDKRRYYPFFTDHP